MKILSVVGARPNFVKIAPVIEELNKRGIRNVLVHTGQHYDDVMSKEFFRDLGLPEPDINLGVRSGSHAVQTAGIMTGFEGVLVQEKPDIMIVVGDVNSTLACCVVASKIQYPDNSKEGNENSHGGRERPVICHVEAGLRSFDRRMPEEINRIVTDTLSDVLFVTEESGRINLLNEGKQESQIHFVGNVMIDSLVKHKALAMKRITRFDGLKGHKYGVVTLHRPSNVDRKKSLDDILGGLADVSEKASLFFPMHPRTRKQVERYGMMNLFKVFQDSSPTAMKRGVYLMPPLTYLEFLALLVEASVVFTDSGGIQEETTFLGIPCITIRENTERPVTVYEGTNTVVGMKRDKILDAGIGALEGRGKKGRIPKLWDGKVAERIVEVLVGLET
jgi:UDP-N-acetylglucosamine 2-epimerase (non-hydrolysing)